MENTSKSKFMSSAEQMKEDLGPALCLAKWKQVSLHLATGLNNSCYHPPLHLIDPEAIKTNPSALHNTGHKKAQRKIMLRQERPTECSYCWTMEDFQFGCAVPRAHSVRGGCPDNAAIAD